MSVRKATIQSDRGLWNYEVISDYTVYFRKLIRRRWPLKSIEAHGPAWLFGILHLREGKVRYLRGGPESEVGDRNWGVFLPPFSLAQVQLDGRAGIELEVDGLWSVAVLPAGLPKVAVIISLLPDFSFSRSVAEVVAYLNRTSTHHRPIEYPRTASPLSRKAKEWIDRNFQRNATLKPLPQELKTSGPQLSRAFKKDFGLSPLAYRNHLRVTTAVFRLLLGDSSILQISGDVRFGDAGRFYKAVKKTTELTPGAYRRRERKHRKL